MKERLLAILEQKQMSASQFADSVGIQRATFHHIISGRNNPSLDVVTKIHTAYPDIDLEWLLTGNSASQEGVPAQTTLTALQQDLFSPENQIFRPAAGNHSEYRSHDGGDQYANSASNNNESVNCTKKIVQIIVVYSDGTTEWFKN